MALAVMLAQGTLTEPYAVAALAVVPLVICWALTACLIRLAPRLGLVDNPDARKVHSRPVPRAGGLAIFAAVVLTAAGAAVAVRLGIAAWQTPAWWWWTLGWAGPIVLLGLADDLRPLPWQLRLGVQIVVAVAAVLLGLPECGTFLRLATVLWVVGLTNAFNMLDNMDTLSAGVALIAACWLVLISLAAEGAGAAGWLPLVILMGALAGFLWWNWPPARIFMGDAGSTFLGFVLGMATARVALRPDGPSWSWAVPLCLAAVPCYDMVSVVVIRLSQGRSPFHADKQHLSHRLARSGLSSVTAVRVIHLLGLASGASAYLLTQLTTATAAALVIGPLACWWSALAVMEFVRPRPDHRSLAGGCPSKESYNDTHSQR